MIFFHQFKRHVEVIVLLTLTFTAPVARSVENGAPITPFGVYNFGAGILPPPSVGVTAALRVASYEATEQRDKNGDRSPVGVKLKVNSAALALVKTTDVRVLGGTYGFSAVVPYLDMNNRLAIDSPMGGQTLRATNATLGDITLVPATVMWTPSSQLFVHARMELQLPTGSYKADRIINTGVNHWTVSPAVAFTWLSSSGFEISSNIQLNFHEKNKDTQYRSGVEYQHEFAAGQHLGPWTLGVGGYFYHQISDDKSKGNRFSDGNRARVMAIGPAISFLDQQSKWPALSAHFYKEFGARNRTRGTQFAIRAGWSF